MILMMGSRTDHWNHNGPLIDNTHAGYPETTNATKNNPNADNQYATIDYKYLSGNNFPRIGMIILNLSFFYFLFYFFVIMAILSIFFSVEC